MLLTHGENFVRKNHPIWYHYFILVNLISMSTKIEMTAKYVAQLEELSITPDTTLLEWVVDRVGPANYNADGQLVACSDKEELERVYTGFVGDELAETDKEKGMSVIAEVCEDMKDINRKYRAVFYYLLAKKYGK